jgi:serine/threonine protein kinase/Tol biopolymer transport system component
LDLIGRQIGPYRVLSLLGAGGMGEVYRARDNKLGRDVAIKVLPAIFASDQDRLARFGREARLLASLNHPHIGSIYGFEESENLHALVLELVEGPTVAEKLASGPIAIDEALRIASQTAEALEAAHERGIIHRDLKPANIKVTPTGVVKVLDFGLAKVWIEDFEGALSQAPTVTATMAHEGALVGTACYMSPEQARGKTVDKRTDVWSFGCVLFEMLTGRPPFGGDTITDVLAAIVEREPDWKALPPATPPGVRRLLVRCLEKDFHKRLRDIGDARIEIDEAIAGKISHIATRRTIGLKQVTAIGVAAVLVLGSAYLFWVNRNVWSDSGTLLQMNFTQVTSDPGIEWFPSLSPDGSWVVFAGEGAGNRDIYLRGVTGQTPINLTADSSEDDDQPAFSPDGQRIAFRSNRDGGGIFVMGRTGEAVRRVTRVGFHPAWSPDGTELAFTTGSLDVSPQSGQGPSELWIANVASGATRRVSDRDAIMAAWSPHGHRIAYTARARTASAPTLPSIWTMTPSGDAAVAVTSDGALSWNPFWSPDGRYLYFSSARAGSMNLWRVAIDEGSGQPIGKPEPMTAPGPFVAHAAISGDGKRLVYASIMLSRNIQRLTIDPATGVPKGEPTWVTTGSRQWASPDPSPDGQWVAFYSHVQPEGDIYVVRPDGTGLRQLTTEAAIADRVPRWSPDSRWIAFFSNRNAESHLWKIRPDGSDLRQMTEVPGATYPVWSPDGTRTAVYVSPRTDTPTDHVYIFNPDRAWKDQTPEVLPRMQSSTGRFVVNSWSPDGERLAGSAGLSGPGIIAYSIRSKSYQPLTDFGEFPVWLPDSRHLFFVGPVVPDRAPLGKAFYVIDTQSKNVRKVFSVRRDTIGPAQLSKDGRQAYFMRRVTEADIWLMTLQDGDK